MSTETDKGRIPISGETLRDATTVAIVVHGVGDHSHTEIVAEAYESFRSVRPAGYTISCPTVEFHSAFRHVFGPHTSARSSSQMVLVLQSESQKHVVIPVDWSHLRWRAGTRGVGLALQNPLQFLGTRVVQMAQVCVDVFRCIPRAKGIWRIPLVLVGLFTFGTIPGLFFGTFLLMLKLHSWTGVGGTSSHWYRYGVFVLAIALLGWVLAKMVLPAFDLIGDVAYYLGSPSRRERIEYNMVRTIESVAKLAPNAMILIVSHSLGTVLVAHSMAKVMKPGEATIRIFGRPITVPVGHLAHGRMILVTLGSPLRLLSRIFRGYVLTPDELTSVFHTHDSVLFWANLWRDRDPIGRINRPMI